MVIGLTGSIASGKSSALEFFGQLGWQTVSTDRLAREALLRPEVVDRLAARWGTGVVDTGGEVRREAVAAIVFADPAELKWLEDLVHPIVRQDWQKAVKSRPDGCFVVEIPLLHEKRLEKHFRHVVCLSCSEPLRLARFLGRGGKREDFQARQARQFSPAKKEAASDIVITNDHSKKLLFTQVSVLARRWAEPTGR